MVGHLQICLKMACTMTMQVDYDETSKQKFSMCKRQDVEYLPSYYFL